MRPALLVVGHGTKSAAGCAQFGELVEGVAKAVPHADVEGGFLELAPPPIQDAVVRLVQAGHRTVDVVPLVLVGAGHSKGDIPAALERERRRHPGLEPSPWQPGREPGAEEGVDSDVYTDLPESRTQDDVETTAAQPAAATK